MRIERLSTSIATLKYKDLLPGQVYMSVSNNMIYLAVRLNGNTYVVDLSKGLLYDEYFVVPGATFTHIPYEEVKVVIGK